MRSGRQLEWAVLLAVVVAALFACFQLTEYDVCWHLRAGEWILANGRVPTADPFSHTVTGKAWIDFEWLSEILFWLLVDRGGLDLLIAFKMAVTALAFLLVALTCRRLEVPGWVTAGILLTAVLAAHERFFARPDLFSNLGAAWTVFAYESLGRKTGRWRLALLLPAVQVLWVNLHGGFILGLLIGVAFLVGTLLNGLTRSRIRDAEVPPAASGALGWTALALAGSVLACLINPYGWRMAVYPFSEIPIGPSGPGRSLFLESIAEWQSPFASWDVASPVMLAFYAWCLLWAAVLILRGGKADFRGVCLALGLSALAASARRHIVLDVLATAPFLARELWRAGVQSPVGWRTPQTVLAAAYAAWVLLAGRSAPSWMVPATLLLPAVALARPGLLRVQGILRAGWPRFRGVQVLTAAILLLAASWGHALVSGRFYRETGGSRVFGFGADRSHYPEGAVRFLERHRIQGRMFNNLAAGGYLLWRAPDRPVFIDGRNILYGEGFYREYLDALGGVSAWDRLCGRYGIDLVVLLTRGDALGNLPGRLLRDPTWKLGYSDAVSMVFLKRCPTQEATIAGFPPWPETSPLKDSPVGPPGRILDASVRSLQGLLAPSWGWEDLDDMARARLHAIQGDLDEAARSYSAVLARSPGNPGALEGLGGLYERMGMLAAAEAIYRRALLFHPSGGLHARLGGVLLQQGRHDEALKEMSQSDASDPTALTVLGDEALAQGRFEDALSRFREAMVKDDMDVGLQFRAASALEGLGRKEEALAMLRRAFQWDPFGEAGVRLSEALKRRADANPKDPVPPAELGELYRLRGDHGESQAWFRKAMALDPSLPGIRGKLDP